MTVILVLIALVIIFLLVILFQGGSPKNSEDFIDIEQKTSQLSAGEKKQIMILIGQGRKIEAIKICRSLTGYGLKEAKQIVEKLEKEM
ncbi:MULTISPECIES: ribosomal protein L7/L12 [unclassified Synechocystis]|uniref:ribosomal protein L7/L12 n=1 Tax=unclassified Synechocystis TaxID=2640012 RepID=UPI001EE67573|nr:MULTISPECIES: ribosomal protein L7/L12 [unclassified Synechocystis]